MKALNSWLVFFLLLSTPLLQARELDLNTLSPVTKSDLIRQFPVFKSDHFKKSDLENLISWLIQQEKYDSAEIQETSTDSFKLVVGKTKRMTRILISGVKNAPESEVRREFAIIEKTNFDQANLLEGIERVRKYYNERAYNNANVDLEVIPESSTDLVIQLKITENAQTLIAGQDLICENPDLKEKVEKIIRKSNGQPLTEGTLSEIRQKVRAYFGEYGYLKAELQGPVVELNKSETEAHLIFTIEKSNRFEVQLLGTKAYSTSKLRDFLSLETFYTSNPSAAPELASKIRNFYLSNGFARVQVQAEEVSAGPEPERKFLRLIQINIDEGPQIKIQSVEFSGRFLQSQDSYKKLFFENASELVQKNFYNRDDVESSLKALVIDRQNQGYLKAKVVSSRTTYNKDRDQVILAIHFDEGPLTLVEKINFIGTESFRDEQLKEVLQLEVARPLKLNALEEAIGKLKTFYRSQGFLEMSLTNEREDLVLYSEDNTLATLNFKVYEGPKIIVGSILIEGNSLTRNYVILKELEFKVDDVLTPQNLDESIARLQRLGHFNSVDIRTLEEKTRVSRRTIVVRVSDREPGLFNMGIGLSNERRLTLRGYLGVAYRNIAGTGRAASARVDGNYNIADIKYLERKITTGYLEPYLFDSRMNGRVNFTQSNTINTTNDSRGVELRQATFSVEQDLTSHILLSFDLWNKATYRDYELSGNGDINRVEIASIGPTLDLDFRDHPFNPTKGTFTRLNVEYASPSLGSSETIEFLRSNASFTHYIPLTNSGRWVFANSIRGGYLKNMSTRVDGGVPYDKKGLILGGQSTIRGFTPGEAFPNTNDFLVATGIVQDPFLLKTWAVSYLLKSEIRFPVSGALGGALFYDGGGVQVKDVNLKRGYRDTIGIGFRYATPVGAVSAEIGYKLDRDRSRDESPYVFHFSIGTF